MAANLLDIMDGLIPPPQCPYCGERMPVFGGGIGPCYSCEDKTKCRYGDKCYRKNCSYLHPLPKCKYGDKCYRKNPKHFAKFVH